MLWLMKFALFIMLFLFMIAGFNTYLNNEKVCRNHGGIYNLTNKGLVCQEFDK